MMESVITMWMMMFFLGSSIFGNLLAEPGMGGLPTRQEQADVLKCVEEVFREVRVMVDDEGKMSDQSSIDDLHKLVKREQDKLCLVEELALLKLNCLNSSNPMCASDAKQKIQTTIQEGHVALEECIKQAVQDVTQSSSQASDMTQKATSKGQSFLDSLAQCSKNAGLKQLSCYRKVMLNDVVPVKTMLLDAINTHRSCHSNLISIKNRTNDCVDAVMVKYQAFSAQTLANAFVCNK